MAQDPNSTLEKRYKTMQAGLHELLLWLEDVMRIGIVELSQMEEAYWTTKGQRLWDAKCRGMANLLYSLPGAFRQPDWQERVLDILGRLHLAATGFLKRDQLDPLIFEDIKTFAGIDQKKDRARQEKPVKDQWLVLGKRLGKIDSVNSQSLWLYGHSSKRFAHILDYKFGSLNFDTKLHPGQSIEASMQFHPSNYPLRCLTVEQQFTVCPYAHPDGFEHFADYLTAYAQALGRNPFLYQFPAIIKGLIPMQTTKGEHLLVDRSRAIVPLHPNFDCHFELLAVSGGHPIEIFGEWDGFSFQPLSVFEGAGWLAF